MNKSNKILLGVLSFVVVCVVGYALFSETITVTGTATAKGDFDITSTCIAGIPANFNKTLEDVFKSVYPVNDGLSDGKEGGYENELCVSEGNTVSISVDLLYPSAARTFTVKMTNTGTIPAMLSPSKLYNSVTSTACPVDDNGVISTNCSNKYMLGDNGVTTVNYTFAGAEILGFGYSDGTICSIDTVDCMVDFVDIEKQAFVLETGESFYFSMLLNWHKSYTSSSNSASYQLNASIEIPFEQITSN